MAKQSDKYIRHLADMVCRRLTRKECYEYQMVPNVNRRHDRPRFHRALIEVATLTNGEILRDELIRSMHQVEEGAGIRFLDYKGSQEISRFLGIVKCLSVADVPKQDDDQGCFAGFKALVKKALGGELGKKYVTNIGEVQDLVVKYMNIPMRGVPSLTQLALRTVENNSETAAELEALRKENSNLVNSFFWTDRHHFQEHLKQSRITEATLSL